MGYLGSWKIDDNLTFCCNTHDPDTGVATDADAVPTYRVYEDETGTAILTGSMAKLDDANTTGFYSEQIALTAANGFEKGKCYTIYIAATVDSDPGTMHHTFQMEAEVDANTVSATVDANVKQISDDSTAADDLELFVENAKGTDHKALISADAQDLSATLDVNAKTIEDGAITAAKLANGAITAAKLDTGCITVDELAATALTAIADAVMSRGVANVENSADADSLAALILSRLHAVISGNTLLIYKTDDSTLFDTKAVTKSGTADPITGVADP